MDVFSPIGRGWEFPKNLKFVLGKLASRIFEKEKALAAMNKCSIRYIKMSGHSARTGKIRDCAVDFDNETATDFVIKVNPVHIVYPSNNVIKSSAAPTTWAG